MQRRPKLVLLLAINSLAAWNLSVACLYAEPFDEIAVLFEQNATDGDAEVVFDVTSGDEGLRTLQVTGPDKRLVIDFTSPDLKLGVRHLQLESPEPEDIERVKADFPKGAYSFRGTTVSGVQLTGQANLSHILPATADFLYPQTDAEDVPYESLLVKWKAPRDLRACIVVIEQEDEGLEVSATLPGSATSFEAPHGFLAPGAEYKLAIGTVSQNGNVSFVEAEFTTRAAQP